MFGRMFVARLFAAAVAWGVLFVSGTPSAQTATPTPIATYNDWTAYSYKDGATDVCYMASQPKEAKGNYDQRGQIWALITHRAPGEPNPVVSIIAGYNYKEGSSAKVSIGDANFTLFTQGHTAWANTPEDDQKLIDAMKRGSRMVVTGTSWRGTDTRDTYSLSGFTKAYGDIRKACGL